MKIAIASGKGGAGKTSITAALLKVWDKKTLAVDADVEAPNLHLFFKPENLHEEKVYLPVPVIDTTKCTACGNCRDICQYKAIIKMGQNIQIFPDMCHACGGCFLACEENCLSEGKRELGSLLYQTNSILPDLPASDLSTSDLSASDLLASNLPASDLFGSDSISPNATPYIMGRSRIGEAMTPPLLKSMQNKIDEILSEIAVNNDFDTLIDCPPGVSCPAMTVVRESDALILVAEPSPFGFYDFKLAHAAFTQLNKPTAVIINKTHMQGNEEGDALMRAYCKDANLSIIGEIPFMEEVARFYAKGMILSEFSKEWEDRFKNIALNMQAFIKEHCHEN